ncbi:hypothetical protein L218DRAFT_1005016 [Marasmius fiardii PR-910]|nr:hypothetical protein L218DRAFT_1005016 [Marasmius fiardii PR-910]
MFISGTLVIMLIPGVRAYQRGGKSELLRTIYEGGAIYYVLMFLISVINVIAILTLSPDLVLLLCPFERLLHSILTSRAVLDLRQAAWRRSQSQTFQMLSQLQFQATQSSDQEIALASSHIDHAAASTNQRLASRG